LKTVCKEISSSIILYYSTKSDFFREQEQVL